jgi:GntR family transcriptional repressor for pyruvate dehydrogenase complex
MEKGAIVMNDTRKSGALLSQLNMEPGYKRVARMIENKIVSGGLEAGQLLPTETDLAEQLGVHRSTVREGIRSLENAGLVRRGAGKRLQICAPEIPAISSVVARALGLRKISFFELWEMQMELEPFAAGLAAQRASAEIKAELQANVVGLRENIDDHQYVQRNDTEFHILIAEAAQNAALSISAAPIGALLFSATEELYARVSQARHRLLVAHEAILAAVVAGDPDEATLWMRRHIQDFHKGYELAGFDIHAPITLVPSAFSN